VLSLEEVEAAIAAVRAEFAPKILNARACENEAALDVSEC
jgi:hypothetical protein